MTLSEKYSNKASTTINQSGGIDATTNPVVFTVVDASAFPSTGNFRILIDAEILLVTAVVGNTFTAQRNQENTIRAGHLNGTIIYQILTKGGLDQIISDNVQVDTYANIPANEKAGRLFLPNDGFGVFSDRGNSWSSFGPIWPTKAPNNSLFSWVNQGGALCSQVGSGLSLITASSSGDQLRARVKPKPAFPANITVGLLATCNNINAIETGVCFYDSVLGRFICGGFAGSNRDSIVGKGIYGTRWSSSSAFGVRYNAFSLRDLYAPVMWFKLREDAVGAYSVLYSTDKINFFVLGSEQTGFMTADKVGFFINANVSGETGSLFIFSWEE